MPAGVFNMVYGGGVGKWLVKHPAIQAVGFTGSLKGGRALCDMAAARPHPIPVFAEISSINPVLMLPAALEARGEKIARELADSVVQGCGQFCTNPGLVIGIASPAFSLFVANLIAEIGQRPPQTMLNAGTLESYEHGLAALHAHPGLNTWPASRRKAARPARSCSRPMYPCCWNGDELLQEEVFGPVTVVVEVADEAQLIRALHGLRGQLTATLTAEPADLEAHGDLLPLLEQKVGRVLFNGYPTGVEVCDAMVHGGPYPATSDARGTSVGSLAIDRFLRPGVLPELPGRPAAGCPEKRQPAGPGPAGRRHHHAGIAGLKHLVSGSATSASLLSPGSPGLFLPTGKPPLPSGRGPGEGASGDAELPCLWPG